MHIFLTPIYLRHFPIIYIFISLKWLFSIVCLQSILPSMCGYEVLHERGVLKKHDIHCKIKSYKFNLLEKLIV